MSDEGRLRQYLEKVTVDLRRANRRVADLEQRAQEPIAIVGMACRYPGGASSPERLWELTAEGRDGIGEFPSDRGWDLEGLYDPDPDASGTSYAREGGFLEGAGDFDAGFFGISPREALATDPQQRLLLEASWEALEDAGIAPHLLRKTQVGVFAGVLSQDYGTVDSEPSRGSTTSVVSGRVAYTLGLEGPAITVDTACSSSLVAMHLAAGALRGGECSLALAGGVSVLAAPSGFVFFSRQRGLAPDGRCKPFAEAADGMGISEGAGMLVLERLSEARRNGHPVLATIRGSAVNQDGASNGLTAPNGPAQERVIRQALANAGLNASDIDAVEAHGTGTTLGDPIEAGALLATYGQEREQPLALGSVKSNIGHTQAAAGVAGVIKMVLAMGEGVLPPTLHLDSPSSKVDWDSGRIELLSEAREWAPGERPRRAGVSSFGISGTNAHLILEEAPESAEVEEPEASKDGEPGEGEAPFQGPLLFPLSAKSEPALRESAARLAAHLRERPELGPSDVAHSLATTRSSFEHRAIAVAGDREELLESLVSLAREGEGPSLARGLAHSDPRPVFLFPGQGSQWEGMALELLERSPVFAAHMQECEVALSPHVDWSLREVLGEAGGKWLGRLDIVQPLLFATMVSLAELWRACGVRPAAVAGHSQGEIAAAHIAGGLSLEDAARIVALRAKAMAGIAGQGGMLSVALDPEGLAPRLDRFGTRLSLAALNGPTSLVVSGEPGALEELQAACEQDGVRTQPIAVDYAAHSAQIDALQDELLEAFAPISPTTGEIPFHSTVTGGPLDTAELDASYWYRNLRETVRFEPVMRSLLEAGRRTFVEIGPHPVLTFGAEETIEDTLGEGEGATVLGTLRRDEGGPERFALSLAHAHAHGADLDWEALTGPAERVALPTYPFQRRRYWLSSTDAPAELSAAGLSAAEHPLLGARIEDPEGEGLILSGRISLSTHPWLADHAVTGAVILPGAAFLELALRAAEEVGAQSVEELVLQAPLPLAERGAVALQVRLAAPDGQGRREISIHSRPEEREGQWTCHARGVLSQEAPASPEPLGAWPPPAAEPIAVTELYERLAQSGFEYGPAFQGLEAAWREGEEIYAEVSLAPEQATEAGRYLLHPALLDAAAHAGIEPMLSSTGAAEGQPGLPFAWREVGVLGPGAATLRIRWRFDAEGATATASDESGAPVLSVGSVLLRALEPAALAAARRLPLHRLAWKEIELPSAPAPAAALLGEETPELAAAERYRDPAALREAIAAGAGAPAIALAAPRERGAGEDVPRAAAAATRQALELAQRWAGAEGLQDSRLVLLTSNAVCAAQGEAPDLPTAPLWGLLRSAHSEHPERFALLDTDGSEASLAALPAALALAASEPQIALREGRALVPRLERAAAPEPSSATPIDPHATVLITGATSGIGALLARHLAAEHGARHLLLVSRSGERAPGAEQLRAELAELGCEARIAACDVSDREALAELFDSIPPEHPLGAIFHSAALLADGVLESLDAERLHQVMAPKADGAWHLHELSAGLELSAFVLFSSAAGLLGGAGQANYAAANAFLDALAAHRRSRGLPAVSLAWGLWNQRSAIGGGEEEAETLRFAQQVRTRLGFTPMPPEQGMQLLDAALASEPSLLAPVAFDGGVLRAQAQGGSLPSVLRGLLRGAPRRRAGSGTLAGRLAAMPEAEREPFVLDLVRTEVAAVLGHSSGREVEPERAFKELGFDSLGAVELRNRLNAATGLRLPATVVFDYPSAVALAEFLCGEAQGREREVQVVSAAAGSDEPIAIIGMGCRFPGGVGSPRELWQLVAEGRDAISGFPADRGWDLDGLYHPDPDHPGTSYAREGGFLLDAADFDASFFSISPREAEAMDPQHRMLLEVAWEAFEDAGLDPQALRGSATGVFAAVGPPDYGRGIDPNLEPLITTNMLSSLGSGRIAYAFGLSGPAISVDTACSSSLVATHLAAQALRSGECSLALAGGACVMSTPIAFVGSSRGRALAGDGRSKSFAEGADGTGFAEGVGMLVLERLSDAVRNGHPVLAAIRGSALNQDGASNGLAAPSRLAQERVIRQALANAGLRAADVDVVEAHGTGTALGDPIEAGALLDTYGQERDKPIWLGSIKSNIGHPQAAAGVAGVIKMVMAMRAGVLPRTLHAERRSTKIDWSAGDLELLVESLPWKANGRPRRAAVSSFGVSGTNAHLLLEEPVATDRDTALDGDVSDSRPPVLSGSIPLVFSAKSEFALREMAARLRIHLEENPDLDPVDVAFSLATTRASLPHRAAAVGQDRGELLRSLAALAAGADTPRIHVGVARADQKPVFVFPGHGSQWPGMGLELLEASPPFAAKMRECQEALEPYRDWSIEDVLRGENAMPANRPDIVQPVLFAVMVSLAELWRAAGVEPAAVVGQSQGEVAAAHVAGGLSLEDATMVVARRSTLGMKLSGHGKMIAVRSGAEQLGFHLQRWNGCVEIGALVGPNSTVLSGDAAALEEIVAECAAAGVPAIEIPGAEGASHSRYVEPLREEGLAAAASISPRSGEIPFHSTVTGEPIDTALLDAEYWYRNGRQTVLFEPTIRGLIGGGSRVLIQVSPHPVLSFGLRETVDAAGDPDAVAVLSTLRRDEGGPERFALSLAKAYAAGAAVDWTAFFEGTSARRVSLPTYPFQRQRYWLEAPPTTGDARAAGLSAADHPLLAAVVDPPEDGGLRLTGRLELASQSWIADHSIEGSAVLPGTALLDMALHAGRVAGAEELAELTLEAPIAPPVSKAIQIWVSVDDPDADGDRRVSIHSRTEVDQDAEPLAWTCNARGVLTRRSADADPSLAELAGADWPPEGAEPLDVERVYDRLADAGLELGAAFQGLQAAWRRGQDTFVEAALSEDLAEGADGFGLHPALLEAATYAWADSLPDGVGRDGDGTGEVLRPTAWRGVRLETRGAKEIRALLRGDRGRCSLSAVDGEGAPVISIESVSGRPLEPTAGADRRGLYRFEWHPLSSGSSGAAGAVAALGEVSIGDLEADRHPDLGSLVEAIEAGGAVPETVLVAGGERETLRQALAAEPLLAARFALLGDAAPECFDVALPESGGRLSLLDTDGTKASEGALVVALALVAEEPQIVLHNGVLLAPRLVRTGVEELAGEDAPRRLLLVDEEGGGRADEAIELKAELNGLGVSVDAAEVVDATALEAAWRLRDSADGLPLDRLLVAAKLRRGLLRAGAKDGTLPAVLRGLVPASGRHRHGAGSLRQRLTGVPDDAREEIALDLIRAQLAAMLGHGSLEEIGPDQAVHELGIDSLGALELLKRLEASTEVSVPILALSDHPTPRALARYLLRELLDTSSGSAAKPEGELVALLGKAREDDTIDEFIGTLTAASRFRPIFEDPGDAEGLPRVVRLSQGGDLPPLVLMPSIGPLSGVQEYARVAKSFHKDRSVYAVSLPGFVAGERMPGSVRAMVQIGAEAIAQSEIASDFALAGHSSGGWVAHALASHLEGIGIDPVAVVLLDTPWPRAELAAKIAPRVLAAMYETAGEDMGIDDVRLTASGGYGQLFLDWLPEELRAPVVLIRASEPSLGIEPAGTDDWKVTWDLPHSLVDVPGDHMTMMQDHAESTAAAMRSALNTDVNYEQIREEGGQK